jgi:hypothetical protein
MLADVLMWKIIRSPDVRTFDKATSKLSLVCGESAANKERSFGTPEAPPIYAQPSM